jgi:tellurite resistance protein
MDLDSTEELMLLKAAIALAVADGRLRRSEMGVVEGLAARCGVGEAWLETMLADAAKGAGAVDDIVFRSKDAAREAFKLLVSQAHIDGEITEKEHEVLVQIAASLGIAGDKFGIGGDEFRSLYQAGIKRADAIRKGRQRPP